MLQFESGVFFLQGRLRTQKSVRPTGIDPGVFQCVPSQSDRYFVPSMNDLMAAGCMHVLNEAGLRIPEDMAVVGFDNREIASYLQPPLTTVQMPTTEIGTSAALHIMEKINNPSTPPVREIIHCSIVERHSV